MKSAVETVSPGNGKVIVKSKVPARQKASPAAASNGNGLPEDLDYYELFSVLSEMKNGNFAVSSLKINWASAEKYATP